MESIRNVKSLLKICTFIAALQTIMVHADAPTEDHSQSEKTEQSKEAAPKSEKPAAPPVTKPVVPKKIEIKETWFVNCSMSNMHLIITDTKNKQHSMQLPCDGHPHKYRHHAQSLKKAVCYEKATSQKVDTVTIPLSQSDLNTYEVFVFNWDQKVEKYKYKSIKEKNVALKYARMTKNEKLFHEISDQPIYNP